MYTSTVFYVGMTEGVILGLLLALLIISIKHMGS